MKNKYLIISKRNKEGFIQYRNFSDEPLVAIMEEETPFTKEDAFNSFKSITKILEERDLNINHFNIFSGADIDDIKRYW
jgi:hypothetical protein